MWILQHQHRWRNCCRSHSDPILLWQAMHTLYRAYQKVFFLYFSIYSMCICDMFSRNKRQTCNVVYSSSSGSKAFKCHSVWVRCSRILCLYIYELFSIHFEMKILQNMTILFMWNEAKYFKQGLELFLHTLEYWNYPYSDFNGILVQL